MGSLISPPGPWRSLCLGPAARHSLYDKPWNIADLSTEYLGPWSHRAQLLFTKTKCPSLLEACCVRLDVVLATRNVMIWLLLAVATAPAENAHRRPCALPAPAAYAAVLAYRPSALLAPAVLAAVVAYRRLSALLATRLLPPMLAVVLPLFRPDPPPLEPAALERHRRLVLIFAFLFLRRRDALLGGLALGRGHVRVALAGGATRRMYGSCCVTRSLQLTGHFISASRRLSRTITAKTRLLMISPTSTLCASIGKSTN